MIRFLTYFLVCFIFISCTSQTQNPKRTIEVTFQSEGVGIAGRLWLPEGDGPFPAMVVGHGSGQTTSNSSSFVGEHFSSLGIAFLSYDKRGVGKSGGKYVGRNNTSDQNLKLLAKDIGAGIEYLRSRKDIDANKIGLWGVSQAGWILPIVATEVEGVYFTILISGPTVRTGEENVYSDLTGDTNREIGMTQEEISEILKKKGQYGFDPYPYLNEMNMPGLWLLGERDESIPIPETISNLDRLIENGRNFEYHVFPGANHGLRTQGNIVRDYWKKQDAFLANVLDLDLQN